MSSGKTPEQLLNYILQSGMANQSQINELTKKAKSLASLFGYKG